MKFFAYCFFSATALLAGLPATSQVNPRFEAVLVDEDHRSIGGAIIRNFNNADMSISDTSGYFSIGARDGDSLFIMAMGYEFLAFQVRPWKDRVIELKRHSYQLKEVEVVDNKAWEKFKEDFLDADIPEEKIEIPGLPKGNVNPVPIPYRSKQYPGGINFFSAIRSPFSALNFAFGKEEREKRKVRKLMVEYQRNIAYDKVVNADTIRSYIDVPDSLISEFVVYCHRHIEDKYLDNTYYYQEIIRNLYANFLEEKGLKQ